MSRACRAYKLKLYGNLAKFDTARYTHNRFCLYVEMLIGKLFFNQVPVRTNGMGLLAARAKYKAFNMVKTLKRVKKVTGNKINIPYKPNIGCEARLELSENSYFDYWIRTPNQWTKHDGVRLPAKSHKALNRALADGWKLSKLCEFKPINGNFYAIVFVSKEVAPMAKPKKFIGCDVGIRQSISLSNGYIGHGLSKIMRVQKRRHAERRRQKHKISSKEKSTIKQILNREAKVLLRRSQITRSGIAIEKPKRLANLRSGKLQGWARSYFGNRINILAQENGVCVEEVSPYQTSITCSKCFTVDKQSRFGRLFRCRSCGHTDHADVNAAKNIERLATEISERKNSERMSEPKHEPHTFSRRD